MIRAVLGELGFIAFGLAFDDAVVFFIRKRIDLFLGLHKMKIARRQFVGKSGPEDIILKIIYFIMHGRAKKVAQNIYVLGTANDVGEPGFVGAFKKISFQLKSVAVAAQMNSKMQAL